MWTVFGRILRAPTAFEPPDERQQQNARGRIGRAQGCVRMHQARRSRRGRGRRIAKNVITNFGLAEYLRHGTGHGVGFSPMSAYSIPQLHMKSSDVLREGMVFNVEPAVYVDGYGGIRHCDMVAVTATGYELAHRFSIGRCQLSRCRCFDSGQTAIC